MSLVTTLSIEIVQSCQILISELLKLNSRTVDVDGQWMRRDRKLVSIFKMLNFEEISEKFCNVNYSDTTLD